MCSNMCSSRNTYVFHPQECVRAGTHMCSNMFSSRNTYVFHHEFEQEHMCVPTCVRAGTHMCSTPKNVFEQERMCVPTCVRAGTHMFSLFLNGTHMCFTMSSSRNMGVPTCVQAGKNVCSTSTSTPNNDPQVSDEQPRGQQHPSILYP